VKTTYYHGGPPHLKEILPPCRTRALSTADYGAENVCRSDRVYLTTLLTGAAMYAAHASAEPGWIYEVIPVGDVEPDPDYNGPDGESVCCRRARIYRVHSRLTRREQRSIQRTIAEVIEL
jgi:hypothetical protein